LVLDGGDWLTALPGCFTPTLVNTLVANNMRLGGPQSLSGCSGEEESLTPTRIWTPDHQSHYCLHCEGIWRKWGWVNIHVKNIILPVQHNYIFLEKHSCSRLN